MAALRPWHRALLGTWLVFVAAEAAEAEPIAIVVATQWDRAQQIAPADLRAIYLGRRTRLFGESVERIDLPSGSRARAGFSVSVLGRSETELERYWIEQALTGGGMPPRQVTTHLQVVQMVRKRVGTLGYLPQSALQSIDLSGVRVLRVISSLGPRLPDEPGYPIHTID